RSPWPRDRPDGCLRARRHGARSACARLRELPRGSRSDELDAHGPLVRARLLGAPQQLLDGVTSLVSVVAGELVDVHVDEAIGGLGIELACEAECISRRLLTIREPGLDRLPQPPGQT